MANLYKKMSVVTMSLFIILLVVLQLQIELVAGARPPSNFPTVRTSRHDNNVQRPHLVRLVKRPHPPTSKGYKVNRYKKFETEAFRPTAPGRSPGAGHEQPPGSH